MADNPKLELLQEAVLAGNIPQLVLNMISYAISIRSSDIHIEPHKNTVQVRYRVDGVLRRVVEYPLNIHPAVISRIKIMSNLKIDEQRIPQDGRCHVTTEDNREMDLRVSTLPTVNGEKIVMRIQDVSKKIPSLDQLGLDGSSLRLLHQGLDSPNGVILTSGPTGSGKTTTLYSSLQLLNKPEVNILTIEDPVEIQMDGLNQSQIRPEINYSFANGLRTALRQDPDIIMVGEIRDRETVDIAIEASLTGHLVLSTIHTNSAVETITRMDNMGTPLYLVTSTVNTIIAQRLIRRMCENCRQKVEVPPAVLAEIKKTLDLVENSEDLSTELRGKMEFYEAKGCEQCENIGYKGRLGIYEVLSMNNELRSLILQRASSVELHKAAMKNGMITLEQAGLIKALKGETSLQEVYRVAKKME